MEIPKLPDYKAYRSEIDKYLDEPLLEYVWKVADKFMPVVDPDGISESQAPVIFANRCIESTMTDDEKYARYTEFFPNETRESAEQYYKEHPSLDTSFKDLFFSKTEVQNTLKAYNLDLAKLWYLLLFIYDVVEDVCSRAPIHGQSQIDMVNELVEKISAATKITLEYEGRKSYDTEDEFTLNVLKASLDYYIKVYNDTLETSATYEECNARLEALGLNGAFKNGIPLSYDKKVTLDPSHKIRLFAAMFQYFLEDRKADRGLVEGYIDSTDKLLLISRLVYIVGLHDEGYYKGKVLNESGRYVLNRRLSNLLSKYRKTPLPPMIGTIYSGGFK